MTIVDTHCHTSLKQYEPVESLLYHMETSGVEKAVLIQCMGDSDNSYIVNSMAAHPGRFQAAMFVDPGDDGRKIRDWAEQGMMGIRLRAESRAQCSDSLAHWRTAAELGLVVSAASSPATVLSDEFAQVLATFPDLEIVIEHLAGAGKEGKPPYADFKRVLKLAERPNLSIKLPGFGELCSPPLPFDPVPPLPEMALEAFGPERMMWGSDYPPVSNREGYHSALNVPLNHFSSLSESEREWIFGGSALKIWRFTTQSRKLAREDRRHPSASRSRDPL